MNNEHVAQPPNGVPTVPTRPSRNAVAGHHVTQQEMTQLMSKGSESDQTRMAALAMLIETTAQAIVDEPGGLTELTGAFYDDVCRDHTPSAARRGARTLVVAVFEHLAALQLMALVLPRQQRGQTLLPDRHEFPWPASYERYRDNRYGTFAGALYHWHRKSNQRVMAQIGDASHPFHALFGQLRQRQQALDHTFQAVLEERSDDVEAVLQLLVGRERACSHYPGGEQLAQMAVRDLLVLSWGTSLQRGDLRKAMPRPPGNPNHGTPVDLWPDESTEADLFAGYDRVFTEHEHAGCAWRHPALRDGPAKSPGFRAGRPSLRPAADSDRVLSRTFFEVQAQQVEMPCPIGPDNGFSSAIVLLLTGIQIARETIWT